MKYTTLAGLEVSRVAQGCMRIGGLTPAQIDEVIKTDIENGINYFDHADIYGGGMSETVFGEAFSGDPSLKREDIFLQSKCGIRQGCYDLSKDHILESVDGILKRLQTDYLDLLLLHRPDALVEPEDVAAAFDVLFESGKVRHFGVSNHKPMQIALLQKYVRQPLVANQVQFSIPVSNLVANEMYSPNGYGKDHDPNQIPAYILEGIRHLAGQCKHLVIVSNEVASDGIGYDTSTMEYIRLMGIINARLARMADEAYEVVYGIPILLKSNR